MDAGELVEDCGRAVAGVLEELLGEDLVAAWLIGGRGLNQRTPDLRHVVQEVVDRAGWVSGNGLVFLLHQTDGGLGARQVAARDHASLAPATLTLRYAIP